MFQKKPEIHENCVASTGKINSNNHSPDKRGTDEMNDIQITTTKELAQSCGFVLMGCRNALTAKLAVEGTDPMYRQMVREQSDIISKIITAFAQVDIVSDQPMPSKIGFPVIRYVRPNGDRRGEYAMVDAANAALALKVIEAGGTFTIESLNGNEQSLCCEAVVTVDGLSEVEDIVCMITNERELIEETWSSAINVAAIKLGVVA